MSVEKRMECYNLVYHLFHQVEGEIMQYVKAWESEYGEPLCSYYLRELQQPCELFDCGITIDEVVKE